MLIFIKRSYSFRSCFFNESPSGQNWGWGERKGGATSSSGRFSLALEKRPGDEVGGRGQEVEVRLYVTFT